MLDTVVRKTGIQQVYIEYIVIIIYDKGLNFMLYRPGFTVYVNIYIDIKKLHTKWTLVSGTFLVVSFNYKYDSIYMCLHLSIKPRGWGWPRSLTCVQGTQIVVDLTTWLVDIDFDQTWPDSNISLILSDKHAEKVSSRLSRNMGFLRFYLVTFFWTRVSQIKTLHRYCQDKHSD